MVMETAFRSDERFTQAEFFDWLVQRPGRDRHQYELVGGHIVMTPPAGFPHSAIEVRIAAALLTHVSARKLGIVNGSTAGFNFAGGNTLEPDVSFVSADKLAGGGKPQTGQLYDVVPDLVVEILSPSTSRRDRVEKKDIYERNGVAEYWIVSHKQRRVTVFRLVDGLYSAPLHVVSGALESTVLSGLAIPLSEIFADCD
jgi:Uma2 family endonuclease